MTQRRSCVTATVLAALAGPAALLAQGTPRGSEPGVDSTGPSTLRFRGISITPVGFFAAEAFFRQRNLTADVATPWNAIPFSSTANGQLSEFRASARQSRLGLLAEGRLSQVGLTGFFEGDFNSAGITSNSNESNSYTFRVRQFFGQAAFKNGFTITGGQMWSLATPSRKGIVNRNEYIPSTIDAQYAVGFDWARQFGLRATYRYSPQVTAALALEEPQTTYSLRGAPNANVAVFVQQAGNTNGGSLLNTSNYSLDVAPDVHAKIAIDPGYGHFELKAFGRLMRDRIYTVVPAATLGGTPTNGGARNSTTAAGGVGATAAFNYTKLVEVGVHGLYGRGIGRYGSAQLPDATINEVGEVVPIRAAHGLVTLDIHPQGQLDVYLYGGAEHAYRTAAVTTFGSTAGRGLGYGSPLLNNTGCDVENLPTSATASAAGPCNADTRSLYQGTGGFWYRFYRGNRGTAQWGVQYSYTTRDTWSSNATATGATGGPRVQPIATQNIVLTSFRYYLP